MWTMEKRLFTPVMDNRECHHVRQRVRRSMDRAGPQVFEKKRTTRHAYKCVCGRIAAERWLIFP